MEVKNLSDTPFDTIVGCFLLAFENYFVKMPTEKTYYKTRWQSAKVNFNLSYGMFDQEKLVGFIIHAIDTRQGESIAFNSGTGVLPEYRGRGIVRTIYNHALTDLKKQGIEKSRLEVITDNTVAVHVYQQIGFEITKNYSCFSGRLNCESNPDLNTQEIDLPKVPWNTLPHQDKYSWDHQKESVINSAYSYFEVRFQEKLESFFIIDPKRNYLVQMDVFINEAKVWQRLFQAIKKMSESVRIINVDESQKDKMTQLKTYGLECTVKQYEMELVLLK